jgi:hypothetical protein
MFNQGITSMKVFRITEQHLEIPCRLAAMTRFLVQPTATDNPTWLLRTRVPYNYYTLTTQNFYFQWTNFQGWDFLHWKSTVTRVQTQFQIHPGYLQHLLLALVQEWRVLGVELLELPADFLVQAYIDRYAATRNSTHVWSRLTLVSWPYPFVFPSWE